jgi:hypothetical protein
MKKKGKTRLLNKQCAKRKTHNEGVLKKEENIREKMTYIFACIGTSMIFSSQSLI